MSATDPNEIVLTPENLKLLRKGLGLSQTEMGDAIGLSLRAYQDLESGRAELRKLHELAIRYVMANGLVKPRMSKSLVIEIDVEGKTKSLSTHSIRDPEEDLEAAIKDALRDARRFVPAEALLECTIRLSLPDFMQ